MMNKQINGCVCVCVGGVWVNSSFKEFDVIQYLVTHIYSV